jgi:Carboxypeptidase regulatory-like domain
VSKSKKAFLSNFKEVGMYLRARSYRKAVLYVAVLILATLPRSNGFAQLLQGTLNGFVSDSSGAGVANATVTIKNEANGLTRKGITNAQGEYSLVTLQPGVYTITVAASGFQGYVKTGVAVNANEDTRSDIPLTVGAVNETVTVSATAATLQTDRADVRNDLSAQTLKDLPIPLGRNFQQTMAVVVPGISTPQSSGSFGANANRSVSFTVNGVSGTINAYRVDGTSSTNYNTTGVPMYSPTLDAIENVNAVTSSFDAEQGVAGGLAVNITTKSGTNSIHGSLFEFHTDRNLQAYTWGANAALGKPEYINNQFGGTIGGPIHKDKLFYFVSYQGTYANIGNVLFAENPTEAMKAGNLAASPTPIYDPRTGNADGSGRTPFPGNIIPHDRIDPGVLALLSYAPWPDPNVPGTGSLGLARNYRSTGVSTEKQNQWDSKLSYNPFSKLSVFARFGLNWVSWTNPQQYGLLGGPGFSTSNTATGTGSGKIYSGTLGGTYIFSPNVILDAYYGYTRNNANAFQQSLDQNLGSTLMMIPGLQSSETREGGLPALSIDGFGGTGSNIAEATLGPANNFQPQVYGNVEKEWVANVTWVKGNHNIRAGADFDQQQDNEDFELATFCTYCAGSGGFQFSQGATQLKGGVAGNDYNAFASFLLGLPFNAGKVTLIPPVAFDYADILGFYARDQWQVTPRFTLTYGLRWDMYPYANRKTRGMEFYDEASAQMVICGVAGTPENCGITKDRSRFEPRAGAAYRLNDSLVLRGGYALSTDPTNIGGIIGNRENFPDIVTSTPQAPNSLSYGTTLRQGLPPVVVPDYSSGSAPVGPTIGLFTVNNNQYVRGFIQSWNVTGEQQFHGFLASVAYVATRFNSPLSAINDNYGTIGTGSAGQLLNNAANHNRTGTTLGLGTYGNNKYDSLQVHVTHAMAHNVQFSGTYTWSHGQGFATNGTAGAQIAIPSLYRTYDYGNTAGVARNAVGLTLVAQSPFGRNQRYLTNGVGAAILGRWQFEAVSTLRTGTPFTVTDSNTSLNATGSTQFGNCNGPLHETRSIHQWYSTANGAFTTPTTGTIGNCGTNTLWGPGLNTLDTALSRSFHVFRESNMEFRANMFNTPNNPHHTNPTSNHSSSSFMQATGIANTGRDGIDQRTVQLSLRLSW